MSTWPTSKHMALAMDFQGQILKSRIPGMGKPIDIE